MATELVDASKLDACCTAEANAIRTKTGSASQIAYDWANSKGFADAISAIPTGGGGSFTTVASGTFIGSNNSQAAGRQYIPIGNKMAQTDFFVLVNARNGEEYTYDMTYKWIYLYAECRKPFGSFNLSSDGAKSFTASPSYNIDTNNSETITTHTPGRLIKFGTNNQNNNVNEIIYNTFQILRNTYGVPGFQIYIGHSNVSYPFPPITYEYQVVYFGNDPTNDIIDLS